MKISGDANKNQQAVKISFKLLEKYLQPTEAEGYSPEFNGSKNLVMSISGKTCNIFIEPETFAGYLEIILK